MKPKPHISQLDHYIPGKPISEVTNEFGLTHVTKLASNENPWGCPVTTQDLEKTIQHAMRYPNLNRPQLITSLATHYHVPESHFILGNGSDDILQMIALAFLEQGDETVTANHTFSVYKHVTQLMGATCISVEMSQLSYSIDAIINAITEKTKLIFIANPNNPTGTLLPLTQIKTLLSALSSSPIMIVLDEAYREFVTEEPVNATIPLLNTYPNLVILRTFSKAYGLAGFRIGYGIMAENHATILHKVRQPFNVNSIALTAAKIALDTPSFLDKTITNNTHQREWLTDKIKEMGLCVTHSHANFICITLNRPAMDVYQALLRKGFIIRPLDSFGLAGHIRVSIGTPEQNQGFLNAFKKSILELDKEH